MKYCPYEKCLAPTSVTTVPPVYALVLLLLLVPPLSFHSPAGFFAFAGWPGCYGRGYTRFLPPIHCVPIILLQNVHRRREQKRPVPGFLLLPFECGLRLSVWLPRSSCSQCTYLYRWLVCKTWSDGRHCRFQSRWSFSHPR